MTSLQSADPMGTMLQSAEAYSGVGESTLRFAAYNHHPSTTAGVTQPVLVFP